jgi:hypothetical protein
VDLIYVQRCQSIMTAVAIGCGPMVSLRCGPMVDNRARVEGCIIEAFTLNEVALFIGLKMYKEMLHWIEKSSRKSFLHLTKKHYYLLLQLLHHLFHDLFST